MTEKGFAQLFLPLLFAIIITVIGFTGWKAYQKNKVADNTNYSTNNGCRGIGPATITASPIALSDILYIQPTGLENGGHVTPIDHGYFYIKGTRTNPPTQAPVFAPFDGVITNVSRTIRRGDAASGLTNTYDDYALSVDATCTFRVRFSNMDRLAGSLSEKVGQLSDNQNKSPAYAVKAGELIGYTGLPTAQGIDVWVEDDQSTLTGFVNPTQYTAAEPWKTHIVDLFDHTAEPLKSQLLALDLRDALPRWGKIDYDIDGKLIGSWFKQGSGGYGGGVNGHGMGDYWKGHLSIVPDGNDSTWTDISFGDYLGQPQQFAIIGNSPDPSKVDSSTGLVKYQLGGIEHYSATTGEIWNGQKYVPHIRARAGSIVNATVLMQLIGSRTLKMELFPGKTAVEVGGFTNQALIYER